MNPSSRSCTCQLLVIMWEGEGDFKTFHLPTQLRHSGMGWWARVMSWVAGVSEIQPPIDFFIWINIFFPLLLLLLSIFLSLPSTAAEGFS